MPPQIREVAQGQQTPEAWDRKEIPNRLRDGTLLKESIGCLLFAKQKNILLIPWESQDYSEKMPLGDPGSGTSSTFNVYSLGTSVCMVPPTISPRTHRNSAIESSDLFATSSKARSYL